MSIFCVCLRIKKIAVVLFVCMSILLNVAHEKCLLYLWTFWCQMQTGVIVH